MRVPSFRMRPAAALVTVVASLSALSCGLGEAPPRPNILLVVIDTLRADHCSAYGYVRPTSPNLDRLASEGVRFARAYAPIPVTGPSVLSLFTSVYPVTHGCLENASRPSGALTTMPQILAAAGYQTYGIASSPPLAGKYGFRPGFEHYDDSWPVEESTKISYVGAERADYVFVNPVEKKGSHYLRWDRRPKHATRRTLEWAKSNRDETRPLFAFVHFMDPHEPNEPPVEALDALGFGPVDGQ